MQYRSASGVLTAWVSPVGNSGRRAIEKDRPDEDLMREVQKGSDKCFRILYERYVDRIHRFVYHMLGHRQRAEDCVHDVFIQVWNKAKSYDPGKRFSPWLYRVAKNMTLNAIRKRKGEKAISLNVPIAGDETQLTLEHLIESDAPQPGEALASQEIVELLRGAIKQLREKDRQVIVLCGIEKLPHREVAEIMGWPVSRVTLQLHRAKTRLAKIMERYQSVAETVTTNGVH